MSIGRLFLCLNIIFTTCLKRLPYIGLSVTIKTTDYYTLSDLFDNLQFLNVDRYGVFRVEENIQYVTVHFAGKRNRQQQYSQ